MLKSEIIFTDQSHNKERNASSNNESGDDIKNTEDARTIKMIPNAAFPFCGYNGNYSDGILVKEYNERYCNAFQVKHASLFVC